MNLVKILIQKLVIFAKRVLNTINIPAILIAIPIVSLIAKDLGLFASDSKVDLLLRMFFGAFSGLATAIAEKIISELRKTFASDLIDKYICVRIDEEGQGYLDDLKSEWKKSKLTPGTIKRKELIFIVDHYYGRFLSWMRLPRFFSLIKTR